MIVCSDAYDVRDEEKKPDYGPSKGYYLLPHYATNLEKSVLSDENMDAAEYKKLEMKLRHK